MALGVWQTLLMLKRWRKPKNTLDRCSQAKEYLKKVALTLEMLEMLPDFKFFSVAVFPDK